MIRATFSDISLFNASSTSPLFVYFTSVSFIVISSFVMVAIGFMFMLVNVSLREVCILRALVPRCRSHVGSSSLLCIQILTSAISDFAAFTDAIRFVNASLDGLSELRCAPVRTTGTGVSSMKLRAEAV